MYLKLLVFTKFDSICYPKYLGLMQNNFQQNNKFGKGGTEHHHFFYRHGWIQWEAWSSCLELKTIHTIIFQTAWHFASASGLKFSHDDHNKDNDWIFRLNEISISNTNQTIQWPIAFGVCRARFCSKTKYTLQLRIQCMKNSIWKCNVTCKHYSCRTVYQCLLLLVF